MPSGIVTLIIVTGSMFALFIIISTVGNHYSLNRIKNKTVGQGQHGTARWATKKEVKKTYKRIDFQPNEWRNNPDSRPTEQGIVVGCKNRKKGTTAMVDTGDVHALMIGAAGVGKTAYWLYPCIEYACATGMSFLSTDTKGDVVRNYGTIAEKYYGYKISVIDLRNPTRSHGNNLLHLVNKYMDLYKAEQSVSSVMSTALSRLNAFLDSELEQLLCFDTEIDAEKFCNEKCAIFIVMPEKNPNTFFMVSLIIQQLYREILSVADENGGVLKNRCVFFCDEWGTLPKIDSAEMMFSASRSRRLQIVPIIQSFAQLERNYGKEGADVIIDNTQLTIFGGFAPNSTSAEVLSKALGSRTVMSGSVSRSKNDPSQSLQMIERPLMTPDELKSLPKGTFVVMKTGFYPMKVKLKLFFKWGIKFEEKHEVMENGNREVHYANRSELFNNIIQTYCPQYFEQPVTNSDFDEASGEKKKKNENLKTSPNAEQTECEDIVDADEPTSAQQDEPTKEPENLIGEQDANKQGKVVVRTERPPQGNNSNE